MKRAFEVLVVALLMLASFAAGRRSVTCPPDQGLALAIRNQDLAAGALDLNQRCVELLLARRKR